MHFLVDLTHTSESNRLNVKIDPMLRPNVLKKIAKFYSPTEDFTNPLISPVFADLTGLPPMLILVGTLEVLLDDARLLAKNAERDGVATELEIWEGMPHVFPYMATSTSWSRKSIENIGTFVRQYIVNVKDITMEFQETPLDKIGLSGNENQNYDYKRNQPWWYGIIYLAQHMGPEYVAIKIVLKLGTVITND